MALFKFTTDKVIRQLRWVALLVMLLDAACTLIGQPSSFWHDPSTTNENAPIVRFFLSRGVIPFAVGGILYIVGVLFIASITPRRVGLAILFYLLLGHFFGMSSWILYYFRCSHSIWGVFQIGIAVLITLAICREKDGV
jgi:predicted membrane channel-forming protein YqfA (hemolysin III family)